MRRLLLAAALGAGLCAQPAIDSMLDVRVPVRDGVELSANVFRPAGSGRLPVILVRTPYGKGQSLSPNYRAFVERGYAVVIQDVRGRGGSEGVFAPLEQEPRDGEDTLNWIAAQKWSNGRTGMMGGSYLGIVQWKVAVRNPPSLKAIFPVVSGCDDYTDRFYSAGGAMKLGNRLLWMAENMRAPGFSRPDFNLFTRHLPLRTADRAATGQRVAMYQAALDHPLYDAFWKRIGTREKLGAMRVPVFSVGGWFDNFAPSDFEAFTILRKLGRTAHILAGPWAHNMSVKLEGMDFGPHAAAPIRTLQLEWFDEHLRGAPPKRRPAARVFVMGVNEWRDYDRWPPEGSAPKRFYLRAGKGANSVAGDGALTGKPPRREREDRYDYDPRDPVPTRGGAVCCNPKVFPWGPRDQADVERRGDVLVYTTPALKQPLEVIGPVRAVLFAATSAPDTDFTAKLVEVQPGGQTRNLADGILRLRYRQGLDKAVLAAPGEVYEITVEMGPLAHVFLKGRRVRLEVSSSNFPRFDRNPNTGRAVADEKELRVASQRVFRGGKRASYLELPVMDIRRR